MTDLKLKIGCSRYDHARALFDGSVKIAGVDAQMESAPIVSELFERMMRDQAFDVCELGLTFYLRTLERENPPFVAIPVFPARIFRHSAIFINTASGIERPEDLIGKTIGEFGTWSHDAGVWPKGVLADEFGIGYDQCRWLVGGSDQPMPPYDFVPFAQPPGIDVSPAPTGKGLGPMLETGEIDAFISALVPDCVMRGSPNVARLFPDYERVERDYHRRTGIFPIMHTVVIRRELVDRHPWLARAVYQGFLDSKNAMADQYRRSRLEQNINVMVPWFNALLDRNAVDLPTDWWPYGVEANRATIDTYLRYFHEQGVSTRRWTCEDIFAPDFLS